MTELGGVIESHDLSSLTKNDLIKPLSMTVTAHFGGLWGEFKPSVSLTHFLISVIMAMAHRFLAFDPLLSVTSNGGVPFMIFLSLDTRTDLPPLMWLACVAGDSVPSLWVATRGGRGGGRQTSESSLRYLQPYNTYVQMG